MARLKGILKLRGTLGGLTFYQRKDMKGATLVKQQNTLTKERIHADPAFERTRENYQEFGRVNTLGAAIRHGAAALLRCAPDPSVTTRLVSLLSKVKGYDLEHERGQRTAEAGLRTAEGRNLLSGFEFNGKAALGSVLRCPLTLKDGHTFLLSRFLPCLMLDCPAGATHVGFRTGVLVVDAEGTASQLHCSPMVTVAIDFEPATLSLRPTETPTGGGIFLWLLLLEFFQETNGEQYPLYERCYNVLHLLDVRCVQINH
ncbi:hypothetical protein [Flavobacterium soli]|uniref:hypothetical protein n=1 Tax=Flavobacterium soli TaxID=344881 RepID=UPI0004043B01|nr:hypothetical protein [Flavobacterium soli]